MFTIPLQSDISKININYIGYKEGLYDREIGFIPYI